MSRHDKASLELAAFLRKEGWQIHGCPPSAGMWCGIAMRPPANSAILVCRMRFSILWKQETPHYLVNAPNKVWHVERNSAVTASGKTIDIPTIMAALEEAAAAKPPPPAAAVKRQGNWLWITFTEAPAPATLAAIMRLGAQWSHKRRGYFIKDASLLEEVEDILWHATANATPISPTPSAASAPILTRIF